MSFVSFPTDPNTMKKLTEDQLDKLKENYASMIVDGMDMNTLVTFAVDSIMQNMEMWDQADITEEIKDLYDEEMLNDLLESVEQVI